ncbi:General substrate transporter [Cynara cardunculus var. scolymus]|uniref:General substrate transporter n=1 Tax=Cynara cardunculus var. scolymus TaxID=59895 RepID=A0A118JRI4_CYNCS|nr:General substrate transporter [Cynara cardunculus var. scolymus]
MARAENLEVFNVLNGAKAQWYHFTAIVIAGMGFFTEAYDLFYISLVTKMLSRSYYTKPGAIKPESLPPNFSATVNGVALIGTLAGQLFFEWLGDKLGPKKVYGITLVLMCLSSISSSLSFGNKPKTRPSLKAARKQGRREDLEENFLHGQDGSV